MKFEGMRRIGVCGLVFLVVAIHGQWVGAQESKKVRFGYPSLGFRQGHIWVAKDEGLFKKYGLDVEPIFLRGGQLAIQALAGGDPPLMSIGQVVQAGLAGFDLALIAGVEIYYDSTVFAQPGITRLEQLKGKRIGISGYGAATHFAAIILAQHLKLDPDKDLILVPGGPDAERIAAMSAGKIDAGVFNSSTLPIAKRMGLVELVRIPDLKVEVQGNGMATTRTYIKSNRDVVKSALKGYIEGINFIFNNKAGRAESLRQIHAHQRCRGVGDILPSLHQYNAEETLSDAQRPAVSLGPPRADDAAGQDGEAGTVRRHEFSAGTGEGRFLQRDGKALSGEIRFTAEPSPAEPQPKLGVSPAKTQRAQSSEIEGENHS